MGKREQETTPELDHVDKAIISALQLDGRAPYSKLGPAVGLSQAAVRQRVQRLIESGVMQVVAVTDPATLGFAVQAMVAITVTGDVREVAAEVEKLEEVEYVVITAGRFDLLVEIVCTDTHHLLDVVNDRIRAIPNVSTTEVFTYMSLVKQTYSWGVR
ncbi:MAG: Lrp/AsnC family transcriptional regulator [Acidimicrobiales bacterium]